MKRISIYAAFIVILLYPNRMHADNPSESKSLGSYSVIDAYLKLMAKPWKKSPLEHSKKDEGRLILRRFTDRVQSAYESALKECNNDPSYLDYILRTRWNYKMSYIFQSSSYSTNEIIEIRNRLVDSLPYKLKTRDSSMPNDPYVEDPLFFEKVFSLHVSWRSFNLHGNSQLAKVYQKYKELWMRQYASPNTLLSEAIYMWLEVYLERIVSIVNEWKYHGINTAQEDIWEIYIPTSIISENVQNSFENDIFYQMRMFNHDLAKDSLLFYGLPIGTRLPTIIPEFQVDFSKAQADLFGVSLSDNIDVEKDSDVRNYNRMDYLAKIANQYLRALVNKNQKELSETDNGISNLNTSSCSRYSEPGNCNAKTNNAHIIKCAADSLQQNTLKSDALGTESNTQDYPIGTAYWMKEITREILDECYDPNRYVENYSSRKKRDLTETSTLRYKKHDECKKGLNHHVKKCVERLHKYPVEDPSSLIYSDSIYGEDGDIITLSCDNDQVLRVTHLDVSRPLNFYNTLTYGLTIFQVGYLWNKYISDLEERTLASFEKKCNNENKCPVNVNVKELSDHRTFFDAAVEVKYECAPRGCNPSFYNELTASSDRDKYLIWECKSDKEGILITSVHWEKKSGFLNYFYNLVRENLPDDGDTKSLDYLISRCGGRNKCKQMADLKNMAGGDSGALAFVQVNYKCLPCAEFFKE